MKLFFLLVGLFFLRPFSDTAPLTIGTGHQPEISIDNKGIIRIIYGNEGKIYYTISRNNGVSFSAPLLVAEIAGMHLGMERGPQLASSKDFSLVTAIDTKGDIHSFQLDHKTEKWKKIKNVNDIHEIAKEGLMDLAADDQNNFCAVWLDLRNDKKNNIALSSWSTSLGWSKNKIIYSSPDKSVCECCKPSVDVKDKFITVMFRNWLNESRDLYVISSNDNGNSFGQAQKLGEGTWKLKACPMDGGGLMIDATKQIKTVWQRENQIFYAEPGQPETKIANGRNPKIAGAQNSLFLTWQDGDQLKAKKPDSEAFVLGVGTALKIKSFNRSTFATWENESDIMFSIIPF